jgi:hypothetical protein
MSHLRCWICSIIKRVSFAISFSREILLFVFASIAFFKSYPFKLQHLGAFWLPSSNSQFFLGPAGTILPFAPQVLASFLPLSHLTRNSPPLKSMQYTETRWRSIKSMKRKTVRSKMPREWGTGASKGVNEVRRMSIEIKSCLIYYDRSNLGWLEIVLRTWLSTCRKRGENGAARFPVQIVSLCRRRLNEGGNKNLTE